MFRRERREEDAEGGRRDGEDSGKVDVDGRRHARRCVGGTKDCSDGAEC
jgi:hypothetical protein